MSTSVGGEQLAGFLEYQCVDDCMYRGLQLREDAKNCHVMKEVKAENLRQNVDLYKRCPLR